MEYHPRWELFFWTDPLNDFLKLRWWVLLARKDIVSWDKKIENGNGGDDQTF